VIIKGIWGVGAYSSQEFSQCGHAEKGNRPSQATFQCLGCGYAAKADDNADDNAACVIKQRGITHVRSEAFSIEKTPRTIKVRRKKTNKAEELRLQEAEIV
jgi:putative transposase